MITRIKNLLSIAAVTIFFVIAMASSATNEMTFSDRDTWIPPDFDPANTTLLVEIHPTNQKQNKAMTEYLKANYPYKYEVADRSFIEGNPNRYADKKVFKYAILWDYKRSIRTSHGANGTMSQRSASDLYGRFYDRSTQKTYETTKKYNNYGSSGYIPVINSVVKKYKQGSANAKP